MSSADARLDTRASAMAALGDLMLQGWTMLAESCPLGCPSPLAENRGARGGGSSSDAANVRCVQCGSTFRRERDALGDPVFTPVTRGTPPAAASSSTATTTAATATAPATATTSSSSPSAPAPGSGSAAGAAAAASSSSSSSAADRGDEDDGDDEELRRELEDDVADRIQATAAAAMSASRQEREQQSSQRQPQRQQQQQQQRQAAQGTPPAAELDEADLTVLSSAEGRTASERLGSLMLQGWSMLAEACPECGVPLMRARSSGLMFCAGCRCQVLAPGDFDPEVHYNLRAGSDGGAGGASANGKSEQVEELSSETGTAAAAGGGAAAAAAAQRQQQEQQQQQQRPGRAPMQKMEDAFVEEEPGTQPAAGEHPTVVAAAAAAAAAAAGGGALPPGVDAEEYARLQELQRAQLEQQAQMQAQAEQMQQAQLGEVDAALVGTSAGGVAARVLNDRLARLTIAMASAPADHQGVRQLAETMTAVSTALAAVRAAYQV